MDKDVEKLYPAYEAFQHPMTEVDAEYPSNTMVPSSCFLESKELRSNPDSPTI